MNSAYSSLAYVYDKLNSSSGVNYCRWADFIEKQLEKFYGGRPKSVLDLACGTGIMTFELAKRGYDMTGVDISDEMLSIARMRCDSERLPHSVLLVRQNMCELELYGTVNAVICCLDSLNYLTDTSMLKRTFDHVHNYLDPGGIFIFDMNAPAKFERTYADNAYILEDEDVLCAWQNYYNPKTRLCDFYLSIFRRACDGRWERSDEVQRERCYSLRTIKKLIAEGGFELCELSAGLSGEPVDNDTERWYFTLRKA